VRVGLATGPPLNFKVRPFSGGGGPLEYLFPYQQKPTQRTAADLLLAGARFARVAFGTGGLDPCDTPEGWLASMQALAAVAGRVLHRRGRLGVHGECWQELAAVQGGC